MRCATALLLQLAVLSCVHAFLVINFGTIQFILPFKNGTKQEIEVNKGIMNLFPAAYHILSFLFSDEPPPLPAKPVKSDLCKESDGQSIFCGPGGKKPSPNRPFPSWKPSLPAKTPPKPQLGRKYPSVFPGTKSGKPSRRR